MFRARARSRSVKITLAAGLTVLATAIAAVLSQSPLTVLATSSTPANEALAVVDHSVDACQQGERIPKGTTAIRLSLGAFIGPAVAVTAISGAHIVAFGERGSGWDGQTVTVPVGTVSRTVSPVKICFAIPVLGNEQLTIFGTPARRATADTGTRDAPAGRLRIEYLRPARSSWLALLPSVTKHMALGRAWSGVWIALLVAMLMLLVTVLASRLAFLELAGERSAATPEPMPVRPWRALRRVPDAAWACALVAFLSAASWSLITPAFQVPDEPAHVAYVKQLAETGTLPTSSEEGFSTEERLALLAVHFPQVRQRPATRAIFTQAEQHALARVGRYPGTGSPEAGVATAEPPLYYALESIPYIALSKGTLLARLQLMRLLSASMAGLTALFGFLFLREALPGVRWAWTVGALGISLSPLLGFMSGAVNPDAMLFAVSAALFYCLARAFRRGLTRGSAVATGLAIAVGFLTKLNFIGLAPGAFLALGILTVRAAHSHARGALYRPAMAAGIGCFPPALLLLAKSLSGDPAFGALTNGVGVVHGSLAAAANYIWQLYLPRLPQTANDFPGLLTTRQIWFDGYIGRFGWLDTFFPGWVYTVALVLAGLIVGLCARELLAGRVALRERLPEVGVYALMTLGVLVLVGSSSYTVFPVHAAEYGQARYLLPLLALLGAVPALAAGAREDAAGRQSACCS